MKIRALLLLASLGFTWDTAQASDMPEGAKKVLYTPKVPAQIRQFMRAHGTTRFYGETVLWGKTVALHLYNTRRSKRVGNKNTIAPIQQVMQLDIFLQSQEKGVFERVRALPVTFSGFIGGKTKVIFHAMWLDPAARTIPLLKLNLESQTTSGGMVGNEVLFVFTQGMKGPVAQQTFNYDFLEGPTTINNIGLSKTDARGYLTVCKSTMDSSSVDLVGLKWNGKQFVPVAKAHENRESSVRVKWTGEKMEYIDQAQTASP